MDEERNSDEENVFINRGQAKQLIESAIRTTTQQDLKLIAEIEVTVRKVLREELRDIGLRVGTEDQQEEVREDFRFLRLWRRNVNGIALKIGWLFIAAGVGGIIWIFTQGLNFWNQRPPT